MAEEHKKAHGMLSKGAEHDGHGHGPHHGMHIKKHEGGGYSVHKFMPDGSEQETGVGTGDEAQDLEAVHDHMHTHFMPPESAGEHAAEPQPEPPGEGAGEGAEPPMQ
jgi:hypothetical protein